MKFSKRSMLVMSAALFVSAASMVFADPKPGAAKSTTPPASKSADDAKKPADATTGDDDSSKTKAGDASKAHKTSTRLTKPWTDLTSLSDEQKTKILSIHHASVEEQNALKAKEHDEIMALLSDAQKKELKDAEAKSAADKKMKKPSKTMTDADEDADDAKTDTKTDTKTPVTAPPSTSKKK